MFSRRSFLAVGAALPVVPVLPAIPVAAKVEPEYTVEQVLAKIMPGRFELSRAWHQNIVSSAMSWRATAYFGENHEDWPRGQGHTPHQAVYALWREMGRPKEAEPVVPDDALFERYAGLCGTYLNFCWVRPVDRYADRRCGAQPAWYAVGYRMANQANKFGPDVNGTTATECVYNLWQAIQYANDQWNNQEGNRHSIAGPVYGPLDRRQKALLLPY
jgi:hypothetical protein